MNSFQEYRLSYTLCKYGNKGNYTAGLERGGIYTILLQEFKI